MHVYLLKQITFRPTQYLLIDQEIREEIREEIIFLIKWTIFTNYMCLYMNILTIYTFKIYI